MDVACLLSDFTYVARADLVTLVLVRVDRRVVWKGSQWRRVRTACWRRHGCFVAVCWWSRAEAGGGWWMLKFGAGSRYAEYFPGQSCGDWPHSSSRTGYGVTDSPVVLLP